MGWKKGVLAVFLVLLAANLAGAFDDFDQIIVNSKDWTDIYSSMLYSALIGSKAQYVIEESRGYLLIETLDSDDKNVLLFESPDSPYIKHFATDLRNKGFVVEEYSYYDNLNLDLAYELTDTISRYIVMDKTYSYNSISLAPYCVLERYYVILADSENIGAVVRFLNSAEPDEVIIYGYVDREVSQELERFQPETINLGSKYANNLEIVKRFSQASDYNQYVLTNGKFIEPQFFSPTSPVLFVGNSNVPDSVLDYLKASEVKHAVMIGNDLVDIGVQLKSQADMKIMVKFAKGINKVQYTLDTFQLPDFDFRPFYSAISYNPTDKQLVVVIKNSGGSPVMVRNTYTIIDGNSSVADLGDEEAFIIGGNGISTQIYDADLSDYEDFQLKVRARMIYGEEAGSLDNLLLDEKDLKYISLYDKSMIDVTDIYYDNSIKRFVIVIKNIGDDPVYILPMLEDVIINNKAETLIGEQLKLEPGEPVTVKLKARLTPEDIEDNEKIMLTVQYGSTEDMLIKKRQVEVDLVIKSYKEEMMIAGGIIIAAIMLLMLRKKRSARKYRAPPPPKHLKKH